MNSKAHVIHNIVRVCHDKNNPLCGDKNNPHLILNKNTFCDVSLKLDTQALLIRLLCNVDDEEMTISHLAKVNGIGRDKLYRMLKELVEAGYAYCYQSRTPNGMNEPYTWIIFETPKTTDQIQKMVPLGFKLKEIIKSNLEIEGGVA